MRILACAFALAVAIDAAARPTINPKDIKPGTVDESAFDALSGARANLQQQIDFLEVGGSEFLNDNTPAGAVNSNTPGIVVIGTNAPTRAEFESATNRFTAATNDINARIASATNLLNSVTNMLDKTTNTFDASGFNVLGSTDGEHWMWRYFTAGVDYQTPLVAGTDYFAVNALGAGMVKCDGNGSLQQATAGTDYQAPLTAGTDYFAVNSLGAGIPKCNGAGVFEVAQAGTDYQLPLVAGTDYQTPLVAGTDYQTPLVAGTDYQIPLVAGTDYFAVNALGVGIVSCDGAGNLTIATAGTDYQTPLVAGTDYQTPLVAGTDYQTPLVAGTDYQTPLVAGTDYFAVNALGAGMVKCDGNGSLQQATAGTDYQGVLVAGTDYLAPNGDGSQLTGVQMPLVAGTDYQTPLVAGTDYLAPNGDGSQLTGVQMPLVAGTDYEPPIAEGRFLTPDGLVPLYAILDAGYFGMTNIGTNCFAWSNGIGLDAEIQNGSNALVRTDGLGGRFTVYDEGNPPPLMSPDGLTLVRDSMFASSVSLHPALYSLIMQHEMVIRANNMGTVYDVLPGGVWWYTGATNTEVDIANTSNFWWNAGYQTMPRSGLMIGTRTGYAVSAATTNFSYPSFSMAVWVCLTNASYVNPVFDWYGEDSQGEATAEITSNRYVQVSFNTTAPVFSLTSLGQVELNAWTLITVTWDGITAQVFCNGTLDNSIIPGTNGAMPSGAAVLKIGAKHGYPNTIFGHVDDAVYFTNAISGSTVETLYNSGAPYYMGPSSGLFADAAHGWTFDDADGGLIATDQWGNEPMTLTASGMRHNTTLIHATDRNGDAITADIPPLIVTTPVRSMEVGMASNVCVLVPVVSTNELSADDVSVEISANGGQTWTNLAWTSDYDANSNYWLQAYGTLSLDDYGPNLIGRVQTLDSGSGYPVIRVRGMAVMGGTAQ